MKLRINDGDLSANEPIMFKNIQAKLTQQNLTRNEAANVVDLPGNSFLTTVSIKFLSSFSMVLVWPSQNGFSS